MEITWYGHSCFRLTERGKTTVITDPYRPDLGIAPSGSTRADVVTVSHDAPQHNNVALVQGNAPYVVRTPGEYEIGGTFITGVPLHTAAEEGGQVQYNVGYLFNYDGVTVLHVGDLTQVPDQSVVQDIGEVNVLLLPVGGGNTLRAAQAAEVVALIEPNYIIPMHYALPGVQLELDGVDKFLKAMGVTQAQTTDTLKLTAGADMPEQPEVVLLRAQVSGG